MRLLASVLLLSNIVFADSSLMADRHAPIGVMGDHTHEKGSGMVSVRYMKMNMNKLINGSDYQDEQDYKDANNKSMIPTNMDMSMYMIGGMYGLTDKITLAVMQGYIANDMEMSMAMNGMESESSTSGLGDTKLNALYDIVEDHDLVVVGLAGITLPLGDIEEEKNDMRLGYPMQLGSGSYGLNLGVTAVKFVDAFSVGGQVATLTRLGNNDAEYRLGNEHSFNIWASYMPIDSVSVSLRTERKQFEKISGQDDTMHTMMSTTHDPAFSLRRFDTVYLGVNYSFQEGMFKGHRLAAEYGKLVSFKVSDFQLAPVENFTLGWQKAF